MLSIIIPVLNEVAIIGRALERLLRQRGNYEVVVVDGGSEDGTRDVVEQFPVQLTRLPPSVSPGLGIQINHGAHYARGDIFVFLHVDVQLPDRGIAYIDSALTDPRFVGGGFIPTYHGTVPYMERLNLAFVERAWQMRTRAFHWFAGDTSPFVRSDVFWRFGGYPSTCFASDWDFAEQMRKVGQLAVIEEPVRVDCRRLVQNGVIKTILVTGLVELLFRMKTDRVFLRTIYRTWLPRER